MSMEEKAMQSCRELVCWQKGMLLARLICRLTVRFPAEEQCGLVLQMRGAAVSTPSNLAEGQAELDTQLTLSIDLEFCSPADATEAMGLIQDLRKMLSALRRSVTHS